MLTHNEAGIACVGDPPIPVWQIVAAWMHSAPERVLPRTLTPDDYFNAGCYHSRHMAEIDQLIQANPRFCFQKQNPSQEDARHEKAPADSGSAGTP